MQNQYIIGIGLSAGGLEPLKTIIQNLDPNLNATYIIAEHHVNTSENKLEEILQPLTSIPIKQGVDDELIKPKTIYICPANKHITLVDYKIELYNVENNNFKPSINWLFESLSKYHEKVVAIILSGALNDGSNGILNIKLNGGIIITQDPKTAKFPTMPKNAIDSQLVDFILSPKHIAKVLNKIEMIEKTLNPENKVDILKKIFSTLNNEFHINFDDYKIGTILRRIERRMLLNKIDSLEQYYDFILTDAKERKALFDDLLIVVTSFCRNKEAFSALKEILIQYLQNSKDDIIKIWNVGCATGEESYSLAMLITNILEEHNIKKDFHIFSTDVSQRAINIAREGKYNFNAIKHALPECHLKYFKKIDNSYLINENIRSKISFATHNILTDTPLTNIDLIVCRNLLIYFKIKSQEKVFQTFNYSIKRDGLLFIGKSESIPEKTESLFKIVDAKSKIYKKNISTQLFSINSHISIPQIEENSKNTSIIDTIKDNVNKLFNTFIIIDSQGNIIYTAGEYQKYLKIPKGEFSNNIFAFIDDDLNLPMHTIITHTKHNPTSINYKIKLSNDKIQYINLISVPLNEFRENAIGIFFIPSSSEITINNSQKDCSELEHELIETKQKLKHTLEELNTTNEELQTSNEELQSSNEELITTNEELRSVNESLNKTNEELSKYKTKLEKMVEAKTKEILKHQKIRSAIFENTNNLIAIIENDKIIDTNKAFKNNCKNNMNIDIYGLKHKNNEKIKIKDKVFLIKTSKLDKDIHAINLIDITIEEQYTKQLKKELNKKIKELRKKDILLQNEYKLARMGEMLSSISHQYRQPLNRLSINLAHLEMNIDNLNKEEIIECIDKSNNIIQFLSHTIDDFKNMFSPNQIKSLVNLYSLIENVFNFIEINKIIQNIEISINVDRNLNIKTYPNDLNHILLNIIHNSKDAILETNPKNPYIKISLKEEDNDIIIKVKDNGGGIKNLKNLFKPYSTTKKDGIGIGLYMSKIIAQEKLNGSLWVKNRKKGATFYLRIKK